TLHRHPAPKRRGKCSDFSPSFATLICLGLRTDLAFGPVRRNSRRSEPLSGSQPRPPIVTGETFELQVHQRFPLRHPAPAPVYTLRRPVQRACGGPIGPRELSKWMTGTAECPTVKSPHPPEQTANRRTPSRVRRSRRPSPSGSLLLATSRISKKSTCR
ncbi:ORFS356W, partial [Human betaherpesvirus 5]